MNEGQAAFIPNPPRDPFVYYPPTEAQRVVLERLRPEYKDLRDLLLARVPDGRERALAVTHLQESMFHANAGVILEGGPAGQAPVGPDPRTLRLAAACHSAWFAFSVLALGEEGKPWAYAPSWQRESLFDAIEFWDRTYDEQRLHLTDHDGRVAFLAKASHANWWRHKLETGWRYGEAKDERLKTHPCMLPYTVLPEAQQKKDAVVVEAYLAMRCVA